LKLSNILITNGLNDKYVKIADFGLATIHEFEGQSHTKYFGTRKYTAPEIINSIYYNTRADIYSLGVVLQELFNIDIKIEYLKFFFKFYQ
jgi:serine/threonine protein kinase